MKRRLIFALTLALPLVACGGEREEAAAAIAALRVDDEDGFQAHLAEIRSIRWDSPLVGGLRLELALTRGAKAWQSRTLLDFELAGASVREFLREFRRHPRAAEAYLALAEIAFLGPERDFDLARNEERLARSANPSPAVVERLDRLAILLAAEPGSGGDPDAMAREFLRRRPGASMANAVRFDLASLALARGDFAEAGSTWEALADESPGSPLAAGALFGAAEAALRLETTASVRRALDLFTSAAGMSRGTPLSDAAAKGAERARLRLGRSQGPTLESLRAMVAPRPEERLPAAQFQRALTLYALARDRAGDTPGAIEAWKSALRALPPDAATASWFRAGFDLAQRQEDLAAWADAAEIYALLRAAGGPLGRQAEARLTRLRLEHFLWTPEAAPGVPATAP